MESAKEFHKWSSFAKRQVGLFSSCLAGFLFLWNGVDLVEWLYELFGWETQGYTLGEQRKYRFFSMGFVGTYIVGTVLGVINMWRCRKYPEYYDDE